MLAELDKWPLILQIMAFAGAAIAGALIYLRSLRAPPAPQPAFAFDVEIRNIRKDCASAVESLRTSFNDQLNELRDQISQIKTDVAVLYDRHERNPEHRGPRRG